MANNLAFELGFDWNVHPIQGVRNGVFPLQLALVNDDLPAVISPFDLPGVPEMEEEKYVLKFRVYDFTDPRARGEAGEPTSAPTGTKPVTLQILFTSARVPEEGEPPPPFSPVGDPDQVGQLATTDIESPASSSIAFTNEVDGWTVHWPDGDVTLDRDGRFNFRALLTVSPPGQQARFYRADPEMVIGDGGT